MLIMGTLTAEEIRFLKELGVNGNLRELTPTSTVWGDIEERVGDELMFRGFDDNYEPNQIGRICESILDKIPVESE